jgi:hypothetical protein
VSVEGGGGEGGNPHRTKLEAWAAWLADYWAPLTAIAGGAGAAIADRFDGPWATSALILFAALVVIAGVAGFRGTTRLTTLRDSKRQLEGQVANNSQLLNSLVRVILVTITTELDFSAQDRVSIYLHSGRSFIRIGRYSTNPALENAQGRVTYPETEGAVGRAWREKSAVVGNFPDSVADLNAYSAAMEADFDMKADTTRQLAMKSRSLACLRFPEDDLQEPLGVIAFESLDPAGVDASTLERVRQSHNWRLLMDYLHGNRSQLPNMGAARDRGF